MVSYQKKSNLGKRKKIKKLTNMPKIQKITKKDIGRYCAIKDLFLLGASIEFFSFDHNYPWIIIEVRKLKEKNHTDVLLRFRDQLDLWLISANKIRFPKKIKNDK